MTFKDLKKKISCLRLSSEQTELTEVLRDKPFWLWDETAHRLEDSRTEGHCCFNHIIGTPLKNKMEMPLFDYEKKLYDTLLVSDYENPLKLNFKHKHVWVKKATGLGVTEFMLRLMAWLCLKDNIFRYSQMCIVTGPNIEIAIKLIKRLKGIFEPKLGITFQSKETVIDLNGCMIEAYPSNHLDAYRALDNPKFIFIDEADFFRKGEQEDVRHVSERYIAKSDPFIVMVSTPNAPGGLFETIERESENNCLYKRICLDYTYGLNKIYSEVEIDKAKASPSFEREYNLKYLGIIGNVFHIKDIENAMVEYDIESENINHYTTKAMGVDPGFGSSAFGIVVTRLVNGKIQIVFADEYERPDYNEMLDKIFGLIRGYNIDYIYVDGSNPEIISNLKRGLGERSKPEQYAHFIERARKYRRSLENYMRVIPVHFGREHKELLAHCKLMLEKGCIQIHPKFDKLRIALRTAIENGEGILDKEATSHDDLFDAFRLSLKYYTFTN